MNLVNTSGWIEYFFDGPNGSFFTPPIEAVEELVVPTICLFEAFKKIKRCGRRVAGGASDRPNEARAGHRLDGGHRPESVSSEHSAPAADG